MSEVLEGCLTKKLYWGINWGITILVLHWCSWGHVAQLEGTPEKVSDCSDCSLWFLMDTCKTQVSFFFLFLVFFFFGVCKRINKKINKKKCDSGYLFASPAKVCP